MKQRDDGWTDPSWLIVLLVFMLQLPAIGTQTQTSTSHLVCFLASAARAVALYVIPASDMKLDGRGDVTIKSSAAGFPNSQSLIRTSAGWEWPSLQIYIRLPTDYYTCTSVYQPHVQLADADFV